MITMGDRIEYIFVRLDQLAGEWLASDDEEDRLGIAQQIEELEEELLK